MSESDNKDFSIKFVNGQKFMTLKIKQRIPEQITFSKEKDLELLKNCICERIDYYNFMEGSYKSDSIQLVPAIDALNGYLRPFFIISTLLLFNRWRKRYSPKLIKPICYSILYGIGGSIIVSSINLLAQSFYCNYVMKELLNCDDAKELNQFLDFKYKNFI